MPGSKCVTLGGSLMIWIAISWYSAGPIFIVNGRNTASGYMDIVGNQVHPIVQIFFSNNDAVFQDDISPMLTVRSVLV
jgi:hypothetical protein